MALMSRLQPVKSSKDMAARTAAAQGEALSLAERLPDLLIDSMRVSNTIFHGIHGRRRSGPGETFWQFRQYETTDDASLIDWRRSASSDTHYVREREWEAAHTFWLWANISESMVFHSHLATVSKRDRGLVLALALSELLVRSGERVAYAGLTRPTASRRATARLAEALAVHADEPLLNRSQPPELRPPRYSAVVLISDFLDPPETTIARMRDIAGHGAAGHLIMVIDPAEETLPYDGRAEFLGVGTADTWIADRVETIREAYVERFAAHRAELTEAARRIGWSFLVHHTDRPAAEPLLSLILRLQQGRAGAGMAQTRGIA